MKAYTTIYDDVVPELPGAETALVLHHIKRTCYDFYDRTLYARETLAGINVVSGTATYAVAPTDAANFKVGKVLGVRLGNASPATMMPTLYPRTKEQLDTEVPDWNITQGTPKYYMQTAVDSVTLAYIPDTSITGGLVVTISKLPIYAGGGIDDAIHERFVETIGWGVKARMMRMRKKPWSDPVAASDYDRMYTAEVAAAAAIAARGFGRAPLRTRAYG